MQVLTHPRKQNIVAVLAALLLFASAETQLSGQVTSQQRENRRALMGELLKTLLESQLDRDPNPAPPGRPNLRPAFPGPDFRPTAPIPPAMRQTRSQLQAWETESNQLITMLRREERRLPTVRPLLADALSTTSRIQALRAHANRVTTLEPLTDSFCELDTQWRLLSHKLGQIRGLKPACVECIARMSRYDQQLCEQFGVQPQFNRRELERQCTAMATSFDHLIRDVQFELRGDPAFGTVLRDCHKLNTRLHQAVPMIARGDYDSIVRLYKKSVTDWRNLKYKLAAYPSGRIQQNVHTIDSIGSRIGELLWLPVEIDRRYLALVVTSIQRDADIAMEQVSLKQILASPSPGTLINCARDFQNQCRLFTRKLNSGANIDSLIWDFKAFANQWQNLNGHFANLGVPSVSQTCSQVDSGFQVLQGAFGSGPAIGQLGLAEICAQLDQLSDQLYLVVETRTVNGYSTAFHNQICDLSTAFHGSIHSMHEHAISNRRHNSFIETDVNAAVANWARLRPLINRCKGPERATLNQLRAQIEPLMVKLQIVFAQ